MAIYHINLDKIIGALFVKKISTTKIAVYEGCLDKISAS